MSKRIRKPGGLEEWFGRFSEDHPHLIPKKLREGTEERGTGKRGRWAGESQSRSERIDEFGMCRTCEERPVSGGESPVSSRAREEGQCSHCYLLPSEKRNRVEAYSIHGVCKTCDRKAVARGHSRPSRDAQNHHQCLACYRKSRRGKFGKERRQ